MAKLEKWMVEYLRSEPGTDDYDAYLTSNPGQPPCTEEDDRTLELLIAAAIEEALEREVVGWGVERIAIALSAIGVDPKKVRDRLSRDGDGTMADEWTRWELPDGHVMRPPDCVKDEFRDAALALITYAQNDKREPIEGKDESEGGVKWHSQRSS